MNLAVLGFQATAVVGLLQADIEVDCLPEEPRVCES